MTVTTRRERRERELRRRQREKRSGHAPRGGGGGSRNLLIGLGVIVLVVVALLGLRQAGILSVGPALPSTPPAPTVGAVASDDPARGVHEADQGNTHVNPGTPVTYKGPLPPSSGSHWPAPAAPVKAGVYDQQVPFEVTTHNLEHGGIVIAYNGLSAGEITQLKQFVNDTLKTKYVKVLLEPYAGLQGGKVVALAWDWRLVLQTVDTASLFKFIAVHYDGNDAPEPGVAW
ncbi:MAG TPA: DUF3105 domain-containing protein [Candidatus Limnocylindria bacterium]|nr:DUF3105 domain-containing protein [Candidatus Limnocylindria bacterium]